MGVKVQPPIIAAARLWAIFYYDAPMHPDSQPIVRAIPRSGLGNACPPLLPPRRRAFLRQALSAVLLGASGPGAWADALRTGTQAPPLVLQTLDGRRIATRDLHGKVVIATFWATWCGPCRAELPLLSSYYLAHRAKGLEILGFSLDAPDALDAVRDVASTLSFPVGLLGSAYAGAYGRIWRIPVSFTIDRRGVLVDDGWDDAQPAWTAERLQRMVTPLLAG